MRRLLLITSLLIAAMTCAAADDKSKLGPTPGALTVEQTINAMAGLRQLDSYQDKDKDGKAYAKSYNFSGSTRMTIAVNLDRIQFVTKAYQTAVNELIRQMSNGGTTVPPEKLQDFNAETAKMLAQPATAALIHIREADLKLDENPIPGSVLSLLIPIIDR